MMNYNEKTDVEIQKSVLNKIEWNLNVDSALINVDCSDRVVTLSGSLPNYSEKLFAEDMAREVVGIRAVANKIEVVSDPVF